MNGDDLDLTEDQLNEYLAHYGVKGQKWGVRRADKRFEKKQRTHDTTKFKEKPKQLSDEELNARIARLEKEKRYRELNRKEISAGRKHVNDVLIKIGKDSAANAGTKVLSGVSVFAVKTAIAKQFPKVDVNDIIPKKK